MHTGSHRSAPRGPEGRSVPGAVVGDFVLFYGVRSSSCEFLGSGPLKNQSADEKWGGSREPRICSNLGGPCPRPEELSQEGASSSDLAPALPSLCSLLQKDKLWYQNLPKIPSCLSPLCGGLGG